MQERERESMEMRLVLNDELILYSSFEENDIRQNPDQYCDRCIVGSLHRTWTHDENVPYFVVTTCY